MRHLAQYALAIQQIEENLLHVVNEKD